MQRGQKLVDFMIATVRRSKRCDLQGRGGRRRVPELEGLTVGRGTRGEYPGDSSRRPRARPAKALPCGPARGVESFSRCGPRPIAADGLESGFHARICGKSRHQNFRLNQVSKSAIVSLGEFDHRRMSLGHERSATCSADARV